MISERWHQVKELFEAAVERSPEDRTALLEQACHDDIEVKHEVESLLAAHDEDTVFMNTPAGNLLLRDEQTLTPGQHFGPYEAVSPLGEGGMGQVYLAVDSRLGRKVALKLLPSSYTGDAQRVHRFEQEARAASALNHPNIVTIHEIGQTDALHFIATEFVDGQTLRDHLRSTRMTVDEVIDVATQIAFALQAAHEAGIVHRDIKPENVMLRRDGFVKVLDFGLAKLLGSRISNFGSRNPETESSIQSYAESPISIPQLTNPGMIMGTASYMSPEQARGAEVDARTDVWSLGVVLYEMIAGRTPFDGETPSQVTDSILKKEPQPLTPHAEGHVELERIVFKALQKNREGRYQTAGEIAQDLRSLKDELTVELRLRQFRRLDTDGTETPATRSDERVELKIALASASTARVAEARFTSSAKYLVSGVTRHKKSTVFASAAVLLFASLVYINPFSRGGSDAINSVAVLHFVNESGDPNTEYLSDGLSDSVINSLSRLPNLKVISLSSVSRYKGQQVDPQQVGRELNVDAVLVGRITQRAEGLGISTELVDVRDNRRLWGAQYNSKPSDILAVQEEIAEALAEKLRLKLSAPEKQRLTQRYTENAEAYDAYLRGRYLLEKRTGIATEKSLEYLEQAVKHDPQYALAYAYLAYAYWSLAGLSAHPSSEITPKAKEAVAKALAIDDSLAEAHIALGHIRSIDWDWPGAERAFRRGIELDPNSGFTHSNYAFYFISMRRFDEAVAESKRAVELEPTSVFYNRNVALNLYFARRYDEAIEHSRKTLELDPIMPTAYVWLAKSYEQKGLYDEAVEAYLQSHSSPESVAVLRKAYEQSGWKGFWRQSIELMKEREKQQGYVDPYGFAENYAEVGDKDQVFFWLERAFEQRRRTIKFLVADPLWDDFRSDPRYADLVRRMGLEP